MDKIAKINELIARLNNVTCCDAYIIGVAIDGKVYACFCDELVNGLTLTKASAKNGGATIVKFRPNNKDKNTIVEKSKKCFYVCDEKIIEDEYHNSKYNRGEIFEKIITELYGLEWHKDNNRIDKLPDITISNIKYSIKYQNAQFINEQTLINIETGK